MVSLESELIHKKRGSTSFKGEAAIHKRVFAGIALRQSLPSDPEHLAYSKRKMAQDQVEVMQSLGYREFAVVGHDRGARVAHRMALDHAEKVTKLALLDIVPTRWAFDNVDWEREYSNARFCLLRLVSSAFWIRFA